MLCLTSRPGDSIRLTHPDGTVIWVQVIGYTQSGRVRIGLRAPRTVEIVRNELLPAEERMGAARDGAGL